jgi:hypothetical protein
MWTDELVLISCATEADATDTNERGFPVQVGDEMKDTVYANIKSVGYREFYEAQKAGYTAEMKFEIFCEEYDGQKIAVHDGQRYKVLRTYRDPDKPDLIELTLSDLSEEVDGNGET